MTQFSPGFISGGAGTTWNPLDKSAGTTLSNGNLTATFAATATPEGVRSTVSVPAGGKVYFEAVATGGSSFVGFANPTHPLTSDPSADQYSLIWVPDGSVLWSGIFLPGGGAAPWSPGNRLCFALDLGATNLWLRVAGGAWSGGGDPAAGTGGLIYPVPAPSFAFAVGANSSSVVANFGGSAFVHAVPAGFTPGFG